jgi:hypothetical protein
VKLSLWQFVAHFSAVSAPARFLLQCAGNFAPLADLVPVFSVHRFLCLGRSSCRWSSCGGSPNLSWSELTEAVFSPVQQSFGQVFIFVAGNFIDAQVLVRASMPVSFHHSAQRQRQLVFRSSSTPRVNTSVFASCVSPPPAAARLGCQFQAAACPGSPARWSCCTVGCRSSALIWFTGSVLLDCRVRHHQFAST